MAITMQINKPPVAEDLTFLESLDATRQASGHFGFKAFGLGLRAFGCLGFRAVGSEVYCLGVM